MNKISVIMPVYNTEHYVSRAIESVLQQTYTNWELIVVDDGSTDKSLEVCRKYQSIDNRIKLYHKDNGGQGCARNYALEKCSGNYIMYLDSDDWIDVDAMQFLLQAITEYQADVVECGCRSVSSTGLVEEYVTKDTIALNAYQCIDSLFVDDAVGPGACAKIFRFEAVKHKKFPHIGAYEDYQFIFDVCTDIQKYVHIYLPKWNYFHRENSTMTSAFSLRTVALVEAQKGICRILKTKGFESHFEKAQKILCSKQFYILNRLLNATELPKAEDEAKRMEKDILSSYNEYMRNPCMGRNKVMLFLFKNSPRFIWVKLLKLRFK